MTPPVRLVRREDVADLIAALRDAPLVAVDTEFHAERRYRPELLLVQVHVPGGDVFILDPTIPGLLASAADALLAVPAWLVHAGFNDLRLLHHALGGLPARVWDTQIAAGLVDGTWPAGFEALVTRHLGQKLEKAVRMTDWAQRPLTREQLDYAAADVVWLPPLFDALSREVRALGRTGALEAACDEALAEASDPDPVPAAFRRAVAGADLGPVDLAVLHALVAWREAVAAEQDRPPSYVLGDPMLRELAKARPRTLAALQANRRLSDKVVQRHGRALLAAVARGERTPTNALPAVLARGSAEARAVAFLELFGTVHAAAHRYAAPLVLPRARLEEIVARRAATPEAVAAVLGAWRAAIGGDAIHAAVSGEIGLRLEGWDAVLTNPKPDRA